MSNPTYKKVCEGIALAKEEMATVAAKDLGHSEIVDHNDPNFVNFVINM